MFGKKKQYKREGQREWDFEGRCTVCHTRLNMKLVRIPPHALKLTVIPCKKHPQDSFILWPQREDIEDE